jgi:DNA-binding NarL/FixJ family response regulator
MKNSKNPKAHYNMKIKVSQETIDKVKKQGMTKALSKAGKNPVAAGTTPKTKKQAEYVEAVRRLYGETRFQNAINKPKASPAPVMMSPRAAERASGPGRLSPRERERAAVKGKASGRGGISQSQR